MINASGVSVLLNNLRTYFFIIYFCSIIGSAQELTPRAYWPAPKETKIALLGYKYSFGDILTDPSLPFSGVDSKIHFLSLGYLQTISVFGRTAHLLVELPYVWSTTTGIIISPSGDIPGERVMSGIADVGFAFTINLIGAPTMNLEDFQEVRNNPRQILGASLKIIIPTGKYEEDRLFNIGTNRWSIKPELGYIIPLEKKWLLELILGMWIFTDNNEFIGQTRKQDPILASQIHLVRRIQPGFWVAFNANFFWGGRSNLLDADLQRNSKIGITLAFPLSGRHALRGGFSLGLVTETGDKFSSLMLAYQFLIN